MNVIQQCLYVNKFEARSLFSTSHLRTRYCKPPIEGIERGILEDSHLMSQRSTHRGQHRGQHTCIVSVNGM